MVKQIFKIEHAVLIAIATIPVLAVIWFVHFLSGWEGVKVFFWVTGAITAILAVFGGAEAVGEWLQPTAKKRGRDFYYGILMGRLSRW